MAAGPPILALLPESAKTYTYGEKVVDTFNSDDEKLIPVNTFALPAGPLTGVTVARSAVAGNVWACYDTDFTFADGSVLYEFNATTGALVRKVQATGLLLFPGDTSPVPAGHLPQFAERDGYHSLFDLGCDRMLTVDRTTGNVIRLKLVKGATSTDFWSAVIEKTYKLNVAPFDAWPNADGTAMIYCVGNAVKVWDLEKDRFVRTVVTV